MNWLLGSSNTDSDPDTGDNVDASESNGTCSCTIATMIAGSSNINNFSISQHETEA